jgi:hypothetical protein
MPLPSSWDLSFLHGIVSVRFHNKINEIQFANCYHHSESMAADYAPRTKARQAEISNMIAHRAAEMNRWTAVASRRAAPATGDQFRLSFKA